MRVLQINCVYGKGSTGKIVSDLHQAYSSLGIESHVLYGRGKRTAQKDVRKVSWEACSKMRSALSRITGNLYGMARLPTLKIEAAISGVQPDLVHLHCINGHFCNVFALLRWLKESGLPTVVTQHAEFFYTGNCGYAFACEQWKTGCENCPDSVRAIDSANKSAVRRNWRAMKEAFDSFERLQPVGVSDWITRRSNQSAILGNKTCETVLNGLDTDVFRFRERRSSPTKEIIYVTPLFEDENKGGEWLLRLAEKTAGLPLHYTVVGRTEQTYHAQNITFAGAVDDMDRLAALYSQADACVLTSRRESFSMVTAEALCCGAPVVGFQAGGPETIGIPADCSFVKYGDIEGLEKALLAMLDRPADPQALSEKARRIYSKETMARRYLAIYERLLSQGA